MNFNIILAVIITFVVTVLATNQFILLIRRKEKRKKNTKTYSLKPKPDYLVDNFEYERQVKLVQKLTNQLRLLADSSKNMRIELEKRMNEIKKLNDELSMWKDSYKAVAERLQHKENPNKFKPMTLDDVLDKIKEQGMDSLTEEERRLLKNIDE